MSTHSCRTLSRIASLKHRSSIPFQYPVSAASFQVLVADSTATAMSNGVLSSPLGYRRFLEKVLYSVRGKLRRAGGIVFVKVNVNGEAVVVVLVVWVSFAARVVKDVIVKRTKKKKEDCARCQEQKKKARKCLL